MAVPHPDEVDGDPPPKRRMSGCLVSAVVVAGVGVPIVGTLAVLCAYGLHHHLGWTEQAEAKNTIGAITRAAVAAYERESIYNGLGHDDVLRYIHNRCETSTRVPARPPGATRYLPSTADGADFHTGDWTTGWKCLKFELTTPIRYAYRYETGTGSGKSGATASGFEVSAQGDLDGDGVYSLLARGADVRHDGVFVRTEIYVENECE
jgi:type IV pilus assembly protein PilA